MAEYTGSLTISTTMWASAGDLDIPLNGREGRISVQPDGMPGGMVPEPRRHTIRQDLPSLFDTGQEARKHFFPFPHHHIVRHKGDLPITGRGVGPPHDGNAGSRPDLFPVGRVIQ
jgi:hypothetical protein